MVTQQGSLYYHMVSKSLEEDSINCPKVHPRVLHILTTYNFVFDEPKSLPPVRLVDHKIQLVEKGQSIHIRPHRYLHF